MPALKDFTPQQLERLLAAVAYLPDENSLAMEQVSKLVMNGYVKDSTAETPELFTRSIELTARAWREARDLSD